MTKLYHDGVSNMATSGFPFGGPGFRPPPPEDENVQDDPKVMFSILIRSDADDCCGVKVDEFGFGVDFEPPRHLTEL